MLRAAAGLDATAEGLAAAVLLLVEAMATGVSSETLEEIVAPAGLVGSVE